MITFSKRRSQHLRTGVYGERLAAAWLYRKGMDILARNWRGGGRGEIDIVAREGATLVFVEVKTRRKPWFGLPAEAVGKEKRRVLKKTASYYLKSLDNPPVPYRFDVVEVMLMRGRRTISHHRNAFVV